MGNDWEEMDVGELRLKKVKSTAPQRGTNAQYGKVKTLTPEAYQAALNEENSAKAPLPVPKPKK